MPHRWIQIADQAETLVARGAVLTSMGSAGFAWLGVANAFLTSIATIVAIVSGVFAARYYYLKAKHEAEEDESR